MNTPNNMKRPPIRPNPNMINRPRPLIPPRPERPQPQQNDGVSAQTMFNSLSQAYNNMFSNMQFMNAVNLVNGIYQNANNMHNPYANALNAQMAQNMPNMPNMNANQTKQKNEEPFDKEALFEEFYEYITKKMAKDMPVPKQEEKTVEVNEIKREAVEEANKRNISLAEYLNEVCNEDEFAQFSAVHMQKMDAMEEKQGEQVASEQELNAGAVVEVQDYDYDEYEQLVNNALSCEDVEECPEKVEENEVLKEPQEEDNENLQNEIDKLQEELRSIEKSLNNRDDMEGEDNEDVVVCDDIENETSTEAENLDKEIDKIDQEIHTIEQSMTSEEADFENETDDEFVVEEIPEQVVFDDEPSEDVQEQEQEEVDYSGIIVDETGAGLSGYSMTSKLTNAEEDVQAIYNEIKNYLLSFKGIKARYSSACESFRLSRKLMAKFVIIGKTVKLYLALNPSDFPDNIYHQKDESKKKAYIDVPFMVKIKSPLSIRKAKELINKLMEANELVPNKKYEYQDYIEALKSSEGEEE